MSYMWPNKSENKSTPQCPSPSRKEHIWNEYTDLITKYNVLTDMNKHWKSKYEESLDYSNVCLKKTNA